MKKLAFLVLLASRLASAADFQPAPPPADVQEALLAALKNGRNTAAMVEYIDAIATVPFSSDIYEISFKGANSEILYVSKDGGYIFQADIIAVPDALNISRERRDALAAAKGLANTADPAPTAKSADDPPAKPGKKAGDGQFVALASELALKETKGDGKRRLWIMTAPDCSMCKTLEEQIGSLSDVTLYRYLYTPDESGTQRAIAIRCHHNPNEALRDYLLYGLASEAKPDDSCAEAAADKQKRIRAEIGDNADRAELPVLFFPDGEETRVLPADSDELDRWITMHQAAKADSAKADGDQSGENTSDTPPAADTAPATPENSEDSDPAPGDSAVDVSDSSDKPAPLDASQPPQPAPSGNKPPAVQIIRPQ